MFSPGDLDFPSPVFDYQTLVATLSVYKHPRDRITRLLAAGTIIRVRKGLYVLGRHRQGEVLHLEILANLIYGPSYVSLDHALHHHGLIPERALAVTSVCPGRSRDFSTPLGRFTYRSIPLPAFRAGVVWAEAAQGQHHLMAGPEKALADKVYATAKTLTSRKGAWEFLVEDLRVDPAALDGLDQELLGDFASRYRSKKVRLVVEALAQHRKRPSHA